MERAVEIGISGDGEVVLRFVDKQGHTLLQERIVVSGPPGVLALREVPLTLETTNGPADVAPVVISVGGSEQRVTFDGEDPDAFVRRRCRAIGCGADVTDDAARGEAPAPVSRGTTVVASTEPAMLDVLQAALNRLRPRE